MKAQHNIIHPNNLKIDNIPFLRAVSPDQTFAKLLSDKILDNWVDTIRLSSLSHKQRGDNYQDNHVIFKQ